MSKLLAEQKKKIEAVIAENAKQEDMKASLKKQMQKANEAMDTAYKGANYAVAAMSGILSKTSPWRRDLPDCEARLESVQEHHHQHHLHQVLDVLRLAGLKTLSIGYLMAFGALLLLLTGCGSGGKNQPTISTIPPTSEREIVKPQGVPPAIEQIETIKSMIAGLPDAAFSNPNNRQVLLHKFDVVAKKISKGDNKGAAKKLKHDILPKMDSCITDNIRPNELKHDDDEGRNSDRKESNSKDENKNSNDEDKKDKDDDEDIDYSDSDMITDCTAQAAIYPKVLSLLYSLDGRTIKTSSDCAAYRSSSHIS